MKDQRRQKMSGSKISKVFRARNMIAQLNAGRLDLMGEQVPFLPVWCDIWYSP